MWMLGCECQELGSGQTAQQFPHLSSVVDELLPTMSTSSERKMTLPRTYQPTTQSQGWSLCGCELLLGLTRTSLSDRHPAIQNHVVSFTSFFCPPLPWSLPTSGPSVVNRDQPLDYRRIYLLSHQSFSHPFPYRHLVQSHRIETVWGAGRSIGRSTIEI